MLDVLEIVIAPIELPIGTASLAEILINGTPLPTLLEAVEGETGYAPLLPETVMPWLGSSLEHGLRPAVIQLLGCSCGDAKCGWVTLLVTSNEQGVRWGNIKTSSSRGEELPLNSFIFARAQYEAAIAAPRIADEPVGVYADRD